MHPEVHMYIHVSMQLSKVILAAVSVLSAITASLGGSCGLGRSEYGYSLLPSPLGGGRALQLLYCKQEGGFHDLLEHEGW
jgi:hypothetical protein